MHNGKTSERNSHQLPNLFKVCFFSSSLIFWQMLILSAPAYAGADLGNLGNFPKWKNVEILFTGPPSQGATNPNPFDISVDVLFTAPSGKTYNVPAFYDGNGIGSLDGTVWKVRFSADEIGSWSFGTQSPTNQLDQFIGSFNVISSSQNGPDFYRWGRLEYMGTPANQIRYLKFRDGPYWLKAGADDPENFLGNFSKL